MIKAIDVYPDLIEKVDSEYSSIGYLEYQPMLNAFGNIVLQVDDEGYQGDSRVLYRDGNRYGWLQFGWGSCSGCDALQACDSIQGVQDLINDLQNGIKWFDTKAEAKEFFMTHDWKGDYSWHEIKQREFIRRAIKLLGGKPSEELNMEKDNER